MAGPSRSRAPARFPPRTDRRHRESGHRGQDRAGVGGQRAIDATVADITAAGGTATGFAADFTAKDGIHAAVGHSERVYGPVEIAIFNVYGPRDGRYEDTGDAAFLCSTRASYMTGQFIVVDGGLVRTLW